MYLHVREYIHVIKTGNEWAGLKFNTECLIHTVHVNNWNIWW